MAEHVVMPRLSDSMEEGVVIGWLKSVGDEVAMGDELVEIETDKANMVYEAEVAGTLIEILAEADATVGVGDPIATVGEPGEEVGPDAGSGSAESAPGTSEPEKQGGDTGRETPAVATAAPVAPAKAASGGGRIKASPLARRMSEAEGVDLAVLNGTGPGGRIVKRDIEAAIDRGEAGAAAAPQAAAPEPAQAGGETVELSRLQQTVARRMSESKATAPHFYLSTDIDMSRCVEARSGLKEAASEGDVVPSFNDMVVKACAIALTEHPKANGSYRDGVLELHSRVNVGMAVAAQDALVVPVIPDADRKGLAEIARVSRELAGKVRDGTITPPELSGGTFTVSNLGMYGVTHFDAVINTPQAAILAVGNIEDRAVVRGGQIAAAKMMSVTLSCDHRILYGAEGAEFLARVRNILEQPLSLAL
jgi:pyruvate dehydrogenase E2 component (dihydrolipoamide acetyltransferase)